MTAKTFESIFVGVLLGLVGIIVLVNLGVR